MAVYENDTLIIPEKYKRMSVSELEEEKKKILNEINISGRTKKIIKENKNNIIFSFQFILYKYPIRFSRFFIPYYVYIVFYKFYFQFTGLKLDVLLSQPTYFSNPKTCIKLSVISYIGNTANVPYANGGQR